MLPSFGDLARGRKRVRKTVEQNRVDHRPNCGVGKKYLAAGAQQQQCPKRVAEIPHIERWHEEFRVDNPYL